ncbi:MAG: alpha-2-macroglobulin [Gammaproteobacteria bacterium]|nr:alpha-2-macroglobulin [Gammaproteobacteria bacterium]
MVALLKTLVRPFGLALALLWRALAALAGFLFGRIAWAAPPWARLLGRGGASLAQWSKAHPAKAALGFTGLLAVTAGSWYGWQWYKNLPQPHRVEYRVEAPALTPYEQEVVVYQPLRIVFRESVAPLKLVGKPVTQGVRLSPEHAGQWSWISDRVLEFRPKDDWPVGRHFRVALDEEDFFSPGVLLENYQPEFDSAPFAATVSQAELYQDPQDSTLKKLVATIHFSHPVDEASLRERIALKLGDGLKYRDAISQHELSFDKLKLNAYVHSAPLAVPLESTPIELVVDKGVSAARGGNALENPLKRVVNVPGRYRLEFNSIAMQYVNNEKGEPEQVLMLASNFGIGDEAMKGKLKAWLLPERNKDGQEYWSEGDISETFLRGLAPLALARVPGTEQANLSHAYRFKAPVGRYVYLKIDGGIEAVGGYLSKNPTDTVFQIGEYPKVLKLMAEGALLSLKGEKKLGFMAQGLKGVKVEIARLLPNQLHHLVDQNYGAFAKPTVYDQNFDRLVERESFTREFPGADPAKPVYDHVDLSAYLDAAGGRRGVFVLRLTPFDPADPKREYGDYEYDDDSGDAPKDRRFVLVTDLGLVAKRNLDGSQDVFVQSLGGGTPIAGATVDIIGRNGLPVASGATDAQGRAHFDKLAELRREKTPLMVVVSQGSDLSFLPFGGSSHRLDFSRFDIGGLSNSTSANQLSAYAFTDRGLYRPGETAHIGYLVRTADFRMPLEGVPLEIQVSDPRGGTALEKRVRLSASGLESFDFPTDETAPAGEYQASVYLVKNNYRDVLLGSVSFKVRDFEPDRLKVSTSLSAAPVAGWLRPEDVQAKVQARHLFGAPASDRRVNGELRLSPAFPAFPQYPEHRFHVDGVLKEAVKENLPETKTDANGEASLNLNLQRFARSTYRLHLLTRVFEAEGGRNVAAEAAQLVSSAPYLVGVKTPDRLDYVNKGAVRKTQWLAVDPALKPVAAERLSLTRIEYRYLSVLVKQPNGTFKFESRRKEIVRGSENYAIAAGGTELVLDTSEPGEFAYQLRDAEGNELNSLSYSVAGAANLSRSLERNAELQLKLEKGSYAPGESIAISLRAPYTGAGLITIERDKVYAAQWFKADTTSSVQHITVPEGLEGNAYVNVQFLRDPASPEVYMSPLSYGVAPFAVALDARKLAVKVDAKPLIEPGQNLEMQVSAPEPGRVVVFAIDEGILQVARYKTPDPLAFFFQKRALEVDTSQILDLLLPEFSQLMNAAAPGGDAEGALGRHLNPFKKKRQKPVAYWSGVMDLPAEGLSLSYPVPESFNGKLRLMAVAVTAGRIGVFQGATEVRGQLVLTPNVPAMVAPGDEFLVSTGVFNNGDKPVNAKLVLKTGKSISILSEASPSLAIEPLREGVAEFRLKAGEVLGSADLVFEVEAGKARARVPEAVSVRPATPYRVGLSVGRYAKDLESLKATRTLHPELSKVFLGVDGTPLVWGQGLANYLADYSYSCTEQLVSMAMPGLIWAPAEELTAGRVPMVDNAVRMLMSRQNSAGGFGLWAANPVVYPEVSLHAADFLLEAKLRGVAVPHDLFERTLSYLGQLANGPSEGLTELRNRAHAAYLLTRHGQVTTGALASIQEQAEAHHPKTWKSDLTAAYLSASHRLLKQDRLARDLDKAVPWHQLGKHDGAYGVYYDALVHDAELMTLRLRHTPGAAEDLPTELLDALGARLNKGNYHSLSAALLLRALDAYGEAARKLGGTYAARAKLAKEQAQVLAMSGRPARAAVPFGTESFELTKTGELDGFYFLSEAGFDKGVPAAELKQGLEIVREFLSLDGQPVKQVKVGEEFLVRLRARAIERDSVSQVAVVDLLPGGVEPVVNAPAPEPVANPEDGGEGEECPDGCDSEEPVWVSPVGGKDGSDWRLEYADVRDDRVVLYGMLSRDVATYVYRVRATNAGHFTAPPPYVEAMYEPMLQGRGQGGSLEIVKP